MSKESGDAASKRASNVSAITAGGLKIDGQISQLVQAMATYLGQQFWLRSNDDERAAAG